MRSAEIRSAFLDYFKKNGHLVHPSASLVPGDDPTLLFTNAGMVPFKRVFLGQEQPPGGSRRAASSQKCVRAGGKHNDLEQVGHTARHHTFFEMLGNFSFGDYFKREAISFAWEFLTVNLKLDPKHLRVSVHHTDDEARALWLEISGLHPSRIYGFGDKDNFWQMADTGPCGPCSEVYVDAAHVTKDWVLPAGASGEWTELDREDFSAEALMEGAEADRFIEVWNLVFMQYDRQPDGTLVPLPRPSVDTGMGLERVSAIAQKKAMSFHTDVFAPIIDAVSTATGIKYSPKDPAHSAHRVIADHARAVAFLLADGVFPSNEGRGYVLRRILRRAVRNAWLLGVNKPVVHAAVEAVVAHMADAYPELRHHRKHIVETTRAEEERFLATIEGGMRRFEELAPPATTHGSTELKGTISGEDAFRLYDTFGFPIDLTELMARERDYTVDIAGFEVALDAQRKQSQAERSTRRIQVAADFLAEGDWDSPAEGEIRSFGRTGEFESVGIGAETSRVPLGELPDVRFVGYDEVETATDVTGIRRDLPDGRAAVILRESPFYAESGGQISDTGEVVGDGWRLEVDEVRKLNGKLVVVGRLEGDFRFGPVIARVPRDSRRDTERNHTATHLLHAALRSVLGEHVHQAGSLVAPDRLRFDFTHNGPLKPEELEAVESQVNRAIFSAIPVTLEQKRYADALSEGAMALFGEKYGDVVRVIKVAGVSAELCGGTHVRNTAEISLFRILSETGVAAGVRRIEAVTGPGALELMKEKERALSDVERLVRASGEAAVKRVQTLVEERKGFEKQLIEARRGSGQESSLVGALVAAAKKVGELSVIAARVEAADLKSLQALGDAIRGELKSGAAVLVARTGDGKQTLLAVVTDDLRGKNLRADALLKEITTPVGGRGGGKPHMAQGGVPEDIDVDALLAQVPEIVARLMTSGT